MSHFFCKLTHFVHLLVIVDIHQGLAVSMPSPVKAVADSWMGMTYQSRYRDTSPPASRQPLHYRAVRNIILFQEQLQAIGGNLSFEGAERCVNEMLMDHKRREINEAFSHPDVFLPAKNFIVARNAIKESGVYQIIQQLPKGAVLHVHLNAMVQSDWIYNATFRDALYICDKNGQLSMKFYAAPSDDCNWQLLSDLRKEPKVAHSINERILKQLTLIVENPDIVYSDVDAVWTKFEQIFDFVQPILNYKPVAEDHFYQGLKELHEDNVMYVEVRSSIPTLHDADGNLYSDIEVVGILHNVMKRFQRDHPDFIGAKLIYTKWRLLNDTTVHGLVDKVAEFKRMYPDFIAGFDLAGQEDKGRTLESFAEKVFTMQDDINYFFHAGETNWYGTSTDYNLIDAILLKSKRIGHGYGILKHPKVLDYVKRNKIALEICPISNQVLGLVKDLRNHPASVLFAQGAPVVISNDDPGFWGAKALSYDFYEAFMGMMSASADIRALKQLAMNSITYSSLSVDERRLAFKLWKEKWIHAISQLSRMLC